VSPQITAHIFWSFPNGMARTIWFSNWNFRFSHVNGKYSCSTPKNSPRLTHSSRFKGSSLHHTWLFLPRSQQLVIGIQLIPVNDTNAVNVIWFIDMKTNLSLFYFRLFQDCSFNKLKSDTAIKVSFQGNMAVSGSSAKCNRWFFKFNGNECSGPMTIEAAVYNHWPSGNPSLLHHRSFEGYCENIPQGTVRVELWVGQRPGYTLGDAYIGWKSVSRIMIEEVSRPQS